jgi:hypothetical protein
MQPMRAFNVEPVNGEARVLDLDIAARLEFERPRKIRELIERNMLELERYGTLPRRGATPEGGGPTATEYWLNEGQALLICALSKTLRSADVRQELIEVFLAYRHGLIVPAAPAAYQIGALFESVEEIKRKACGTAADVIDIKNYLVQMAPPRQDFTKETKWIYRMVVQHWYHNECPCCLRVPIVDKDGNAIIGVLHNDHWYARHRVAIGEGWAICADCNLRLENDEDFKDAKRANFNMFHQQRKMLRRQASLFDQ